MHVASFLVSCCSIALGRRNFSLQYDTNIPRQVVCFVSLCVHVHVRPCVHANIIIHIHV